LGKIKEVDDWPSVNFMVRKNVFQKVGGFDSPYWPGEDTFFCRKLIVSGLGKILYVPDLVVWHHRRAGLLAHLRQVSAYGLHRGYFAKVYPQTSRRIIYLIPSAFTLFSVLSIAIFVGPTKIGYLIFLGWGLYFFGLLKSMFDISKYESLSVAVASIPFIIFTHYAYGISFIKGMFTAHLQSKLR